MHFQNGNSHFYVLKEKLVPQHLRHRYTSIKKNEKNERKSIIIRCYQSITWKSKQNRPQKMTKYLKRILCNEYTFCDNRFDALHSTRSLHFLCDEVHVSISTIVKMKIKRDFVRTITPSGEIASLGCYFLCVSEM